MSIASTPPRARPRAAAGAEGGQLRAWLEAAGANHAFEALRQLRAHAETPLGAAAQAAGGRRRVVLHVDTLALLDAFPGAADLLLRSPARAEREAAEHLRALVLPVAEAAGWDAPPFEVALRPSNFPRPPRAPSARDLAAGGWRLVPFRGVLTRRLADDEVLASRTGAHRRVDILDLRPDGRRWGTVRLLLLDDLAGAAGPGQRVAGCGRPTVAPPFSVGRRANAFTVVAQSLRVLRLGQQRCPAAPPGGEPDGSWADTVRLGRELARDAGLPEGRLNKTAVFLLLSLLDDGPEAGRGDDADAEDDPEAGAGFADDLLTAHTADHYASAAASATPVPLRVWSDDPLVWRLVAHAARLHPRGRVAAAPAADGSADQGPDELVALLSMAKPPRHPPAARWHALEAPARGGPPVLPAYALAVVATRPTAAAAAEVEAAWALDEAATPPRAATITAGRLDRLRARPVRLGAACRALLRAFFLCARRVRGARYGRAHLSVVARLAAAHARLHSRAAATEADAAAAVFLGEECQAARGATPTALGFAALDGDAWNLGSRFDGGFRGAAVTLRRYIATHA